MSEDSNLLGRIDGKLDQLIRTMDRHIDDDTRNFNQLYARTDEINTEIAKAKGAKGGILWVAGLAAAGFSLVVPLILKVLGFK